ncbi:MAG: DUF998 domain-containing protein [Streptomycetaceae bacterium]|nr:DUF998 domain-containing protein [Streptomycetaceae bacterium]
MALPTRPVCPTRHRDAMRSRRCPHRWELRLIGALLLLGATAYAAGGLEALLVTRLHPLHSLHPLHAYAGEPSAQHKPLGGIFRATDVVAGLAVLSGSVIALARLPAGCRPLSATGWASLALFGTVTAVDTAHGVAGSLTVLCALAGLMTLTVAARRYHCRPRLARVGPYLLAAELGATVWTLAATAAFEAWHVRWALGTGRRAQVALIAVWLAVLGTSVSREWGGMSHNGGTTRTTPRTRMRAEDVKRAGNRAE